MRPRRYNHGTTGSRTRVELDHSQFRYCFFFGKYIECLYYISAKVSPLYSIVGIDSNVDIFRIARNQMKKIEQEKSWLGSRINIVSHIRL